MYHWCIVLYTEVPFIQSVLCHSFHIFLPSLDLMPGKVFSEQIADMIKSGCRKTIVLLSPKYLESEWCSYEARMALHESPGAYTLVEDNIVSSRHLQCT